MKKLKTTTTEKKGINFVRSIVENSNCIFNEIPKQNDFGNDALIEIVDNETVTGICVVLQIKSGKSYCRKESCVIPSDRKHLKYWNSHKLPTIGIVYDPEEKMAYYTNISFYLKNNPEIIKNGPFRIIISKDEIHKFNAFGFKTFFLTSFLNKPIILSFNRSINYLKSSSVQMKTLGISSLFYGHGNNPKTWNIFENIIKNDTVEKINPKLVWFLAHIPGHGDISWHEHNIISALLRKKICRNISKYNKGTINKLLFFVTEEGFARRTMGQNIHAIISLVTNKEKILRSIVLDKKIYENNRINALVLYSYILQTKAEKFLQNICQDKSLINAKSEIVLTADRLLSAIEQFGFIGLY